MIYKEMLKTAGWREREILKHVKGYKVETIGNRKIVHIYTDQDGVTASGIYDITNKKWVG